MGNLDKCVVDVHNDALEDTCRRHKDSAYFTQTQQKPDKAETKRKDAESQKHKEQQYLQQQETDKNMTGNASETWAAALILEVLL